MRRDTAIQHHGEDRERHHGAVAPVVYRTSTFAFPDTRSLEEYFRGSRERHLYSRDSNPTVSLLEEKVALLEEAESAVAFASGMGAVSATLLAFLGAGDHLVLFAGAYGPTKIFARDILPRAGVEVTSLSAAELGRLESHLRPETRLIYVESPASLTFDILDLERIARAARERGIPTACDNSWATPLYQRPVALGIDLSLHSGTKYLSGHSDALLGIVAGRREAVARVRSVAPLLGACLSPADGALALRGLRTLPLRLRRHEESALALARRLERHAGVARVLHPALESFPGHALWKRQFAGSSGLFSAVIQGDPRRFADALRLFLIAVSWGGHESLVFPAVAGKPADPERDVRPDVAPGLIRLSVGLEDPEDLWEDLERGFRAAGVE